ncbi:hypothetical protein QWI17_20210 [Gilvimarinus sp. SDUM040013]|uniref:MSHA biogenesis protein MshK n=1 Tax=Gilvimarinus gilvus TaxID=3058038 RepID=A0ABU4RU14_9GAMM|nr:hypothetical protein [Gilvimarinus sp. SDUM040013]MDO3388181.1 hypothetical protein [Gilvimarinus sp. SDUM040013]MDX6847731.1 hypothetical protein [Gilvimarinus sp. SDUM040013]
MFRLLTHMSFALLVVASAHANERALRDPTQPLSVANASAPVGPVLHSVLLSDTRKVAIINGETLHEGDKLTAMPQWQVNKIEPGKVILSGPEGSQTLKLIDTQGVRKR